MLALDLIHNGASYFPFKAQYFSCAEVNDVEWTIDVTQSGQSLSIYGVTISNIGASLIARKLANNTRAWNGTVSGAFSIGGDTSFSASANVTFDSVNGIQQFSAIAGFSSQYFDLNAQITYQAEPDCSGNNISLFNSNNLTAYVTDNYGSVIIRVKSILAKKRKLK